MKSVVSVPEDVVGIFCAYLTIRAAISLVMDACDREPLILRKMQDPKLFTLR